MLKYPALPIILENQFIGLLGVLNHFELRIGCELEADEGGSNSW